MASIRLEQSLIFKAQAGLKCACDCAHILSLGVISTPEKNGSRWTYQMLYSPLLN